MRIRNQVLLIMVGLLLLVTVGFAALLYQVQCRVSEAALDNELRTAALAAHSLLPPGYHDRIEGKASVSKAEYAAIVDRFNRVCVEANLEYLWSLMVLDGAIVFTSATSPSKDPSQRDHASFLEVHSNPDAYRQAFSSMTPQYDLISDKWGRIRTVLLPYRDARGRPYLVGAGRSMQAIDARLRSTLMLSMLACSGVLLLGVLASAFLAGSLSRPIEQITAVAVKIARGEAPPVVEVRGALELEVLGSSMAAMSRAIAERIQALEESEERFRLLAENSTDLISRHTPQGVCLYASPACRRLLGCEPHELVGRCFPELARVDPLTGQASSGDSSVVSRATTTATYRMERKDGGSAWFETTSRSIRDGCGRVVEIQASSRDVTKRRDLEDRLRQSDKMQAIGQLAGGVAHDFNNQLTSILGHGELLSTRLQEPDLRRYAENIRTAALHASELTSQLLAFARKGKYRSVCVDVHELMGEVVSLLQHSIDRRITIEKRLDACPSHVLGDPSQLQSALLNLALNSRDAMSQGGTLTFTTERVELRGCCEGDAAPGWYVRICVVDTGTGMDARTKQHLFEPFFTTKEVGKGTGLGLAAVYGTVRNHHGTIAVHSELGKGTSVIVHLPLHGGTPMQAFQGVEAASPLPGRARILVVDDEAGVRDMVATALGTFGYDVVTCIDGTDAAARYADLWRSIDLVILDLIMPRMGGRETFASLRKINPDIRALLSTGCGLEGDARALLDDGVLGLLQKPYQIAGLREKVAEVLLARP